MNEWTPQLVAQRIEEAVETLRRLPVAGLKPKEYGNTWPTVVHEFCEAYGWNDAISRLGPPTSDAIGRMDEVMEWFRWLKPNQVRLLWARASGAPWKVIMRIFRCDRSTVWRNWRIAILQIIEQLTGQKRRIVNRDGKIKMQHLSMQQMQQNYGMLDSIITETCVRK